MREQRHDPEAYGVGVSVGEPCVDARQDGLRIAAERFHAAGRDVAGRPVVDAGQEAFERGERLVGPAELPQQDAVEVVLVVVAVRKLREEGGGFGGAAQRAGQLPQLRNAAASMRSGATPGVRRAVKAALAGSASARRRSVTVIAVGRVSDSRP